MTDLSPTPVLEASCFRCGYDLRHTPDERPCPECGLLAIRSRRSTDALRNARPGWLRSLSLGVWVILLAIVSVPVGLMGAPVLANKLIFSATTPLQFQYWNVIFNVGQLILPTLLLPIGAWLLTRGEGFAPADDADRRRRFAIRAVGLIPLAAMTYYVVRKLLEPMASWTWEPWVSDEVMLTAFTLGVSPLPWLGMRQLRDLARRAGSRHLQEHCTIVGIGTSMAMVFVWLAVMFGIHGESWGIDYNWFARSAIWILAMLAASVPALLFWLWALYLMIRFAVSFWAESRQLKRLWRAADQASA